MNPQVKCFGVDCYFMKYLFHGLALVLCFVLQACGGGGGGGSSGNTGNGSLVSDGQSTSYGYKAAVSQFTPQVQASALSGLAVSVTDMDTRNAVTFGDFFQQGPGNLAAFVMVNQAGGLAQPRFFRMESGQWTDRTALVLDAGVSGCATASWAITADFNNDLRPDVFVGCKGSGGEQQWFFLSNATTGKFQKIPLVKPSNEAYSILVNQAAAADINADGVMDLVLVHPNSAPMILLGSIPVSSASPQFTQEDSRLTGRSSLPGNIHGVQLIPSNDSNVRLEMILMGDSTNGTPVWRITGSPDTTVGAKKPGTFFYFGVASLAKAFPITGEVTDVLRLGDYYYLNIAASNQMSLAKVKSDLSQEIELPRQTFATSDGVSAQLVAVASGIVVYDGDCVKQSMAASAASNSRCRALFNK